MKEFHRPISVQSSPDWSPAVPPARLRDGEQIPACGGSYLSSNRSANTSCVLKGSTSALKPAELVLRMVVDKPADVFVRIGQKIVAQRHLNDPEIETMLQRIEADVSASAERTREIEIAVDVRFIEGEGVAGIFDGTG